MKKVMNREQIIDALVSQGIDEVRRMETHQWLGVIRSLMNLVFSSMDEKELIEHYLQKMEKEYGIESPTSR